MEVKIDYLYNQFLALDRDTRTGFEHVTRVVANPIPFPPAMDPLISILCNPNSTAASPVGVGSGVRASDPSNPNVGNAGFTPPPRVGFKDHGNPFARP